MNEEQALALGRRATRCNQWRWAPGMRTVTHARITQVDTDGYTLASRKGYFGNTVVLELDVEDVPDFRDPATLGCLVALVRDAWPTAPAVTARHEVYVRASAKGQIKMKHQWTCSYCTGGNWQQAHGETEAEALVAALEAAGTQERGEQDGA